MTEGPFWVDEKLNRADITSDTHHKGRRPGLPLQLSFTVQSFDQGACTPLPGAQVDIWHADASGAYSDADNFGGHDATGQDFLRGYQVTDANGLVTFTTIYPGFYSGRAVHIHVKVRQFDPSRTLTTEATTQVFFDDRVSDAVFRSHPAYGGRGGRRQRNEDDDIFDHHDEMLLALSGSPRTGYKGNLALGVKVGTVSREEHGHRPPPRRR
jgi:protocatechuate 3,4-dioxygenase beta subunit